MDRRGDLRPSSKDATGVTMSMRKIRPFLIATVLVVVTPLG
jgi:hypothetical protein